MHVIKRSFRKPHAGEEGEAPSVWCMRFCAREKRPGIQITFNYNQLKRSTGNARNYRAKAVRFVVVEHPHVCDLSTFAYCDVERTHACACK